MVKYLTIFVCYALSAGLFWFCHELASDVPPYSSMGNLTLFALPFLVFITLLLIVILRLIFREKQLKSFFTMVVLFGLMLHLALGFYWQYQALDGYRAFLLEQYNQCAGFDETNRSYIEDITRVFENQMNS